MWLPPKKKPLKYETFCRLASSLSTSSRGLKISKTENFAVLFFIEAELKLIIYGMICLKNVKTKFLLTATLFRFHIKKIPTKTSFTHHFASFLISLNF